ncbi:MAG: hypothetical protein AAF570_24170, partial [Bacteroidota bacterium]
MFSYLLNEILYKYSRNLGTRQQEQNENVVRWASTSKPTIGGISFFITFILASLVFFLTQSYNADNLHEFLSLIMKGQWA